MLMTVAVTLLCYMAAETVVKLTSCVTNALNSSCCRWVLSQQLQIATYTLLLLGDYPNPA